MTRFRALACALAIGAGFGMLGPAAQAVAQPGDQQPADQQPAMVDPRCLVTDASLTWGFKESFRAYIDGAIANGEWTTSGDASYETPEFTWSNGQGSYDPQTGDTFVQFAGSVRFTGHDGLLDTTITDPALIITGDGGVLMLDVSGPSMEGEQISAADVPFVALAGTQTSGDGSRITLRSESILTVAGEAAFPDYAAETAFDPVAVTMDLAGCDAGYVGGEDVSRPHGPPAFVIVGAVLGPLVVVAGIVALIVLRRRARA